MMTLRDRAELKRWTASLVAVVLTLASACSSEREQPQRLRRPVLRSNVQRPPARNTLVRQLVPPKAIAPWKIEPSGAVRWMAPPGQTVEALSIGGATDRVIRIPGPFHPATFNRVRCTLFARARTSFVARLKRAGEVVAEGETVWKPGGYTPTALTCAFPGNALETEPFDELELVVGKQGGLTFVFAVGLYDETPGGDVPQAGQEPELVFLDDDGRRSVGILPDGVVRTTIRAPQSGYLAFSSGLDANVGLAAGESQLSVELAAAGVPPLLMTSEPTFGRWSETLVELDSFEGKQVELTLRFTTDRPSEAVCFIGDLVVVDREAELPPPVLLVTSDTHRADHLGAAQAGVAIETPVIDALAARGVFFESAWSSSNITIPSHTALLTGTHPRDSGVLDNRTTVSAAARTLAETFREQGYSTLAVVSTRHLGHSISGLGQGFDRMAQTSKPRSPANRSALLAERWLKETDGRPLFMWLHFFDAHAPYLPPQEFDELYTRDLPGPDAGHPHQRARYRGEISFLDSELGKLLELPRLRDGIVAVTADHGESLGAHGLFFNHQEVYPDTTHIPLVIAWPGAPAGTRIERDVRQWDVGRTLLDLAGLETAAFPGSSLLGAEPRQGPVFSISTRGNSAAMRHDGWLVILHLAEHRSEHQQLELGRLYEEHELQLFHVAVDPSCSEEVSAREPQRAKELRALLLRWLASSQDLGWGEAAPLDAELNEQLAALGYAAGDTEGAARLVVDPDCECARCAQWN